MLLGGLEGLLEATEFLEELFASNLPGKGRWESEHLGSNTDFPEVFEPETVLHKDGEGQAGPADGMSSTAYSPVPSTEQLRDTIDLQPAERGESGHGAPIHTHDFYRTYQDLSVPEAYEVVESVRLEGASGEPVIAFDVQTGELSMPTSMDGEWSAESYTTFTRVERGIGEARIEEHVRSLKLLMRYGRMLYLCSGSAEVAAALEMSEGAESRTGRRALMQGHRDYVTSSQAPFRIVGQPPPNWSAGERPVLIAAHYTPRFVSGTAMLVCASIGPLLPWVTEKSVSTAAPKMGAWGGGLIPDRNDILFVAVLGLLCTTTVYVVVLCIRKYRSFKANAAARSAAHM